VCSSCVASVVVGSVVLHQLSSAQCAQVVLHQLSSAQFALE